METAKLFMNGQSQAVRLPKEFRFSGNEVGIKRVGSIVVLYPKDYLWETFLDGLHGFSDDFMAAGRQSQGSQTRETL